MWKELGSSRTVQHEGTSFERNSSDVLQFTTIIKKPMLKTCINSVLSFGS